jgi:hypothetical protein
LRYALRHNFEALDVRAFGTNRTICSLAADEAALILARFYMSPPANPLGDWLLKTASESETGPDSTFSLLPPDILVNSSQCLFECIFTEFVFRSLFSKKKAPLTGAPPVRRLKTYSAQSGYVYQYYYEGHREYRAGDDRGVEFVFTVSSDRKNWHPTSVLISEPAVRGWEQAHERELTLTERYAIGKLALFQAFDERPDPAQMRDEVRVRNADVDGIIETLGL